MIPFVFWSRYKKGEMRRGQAIWYFNYTQTRFLKKAHTSQPSCEAAKQITLFRGSPLVLDTMRGRLFALFLL